MNSDLEHQSLLKNDFVYPEILEFLVKSYQSRNNCEDIDFIEKNGGYIIY